jgi:hypothetical protein
MRSLLIDTNILVLHIIGSWDRAAIRAHRRTAAFAPQDYDLLQSEIRRYQRVLTTHGVLTEASNLMGNDFHEDVAPTLVKVCTPLVEVVHPKETMFAERAFSRLGFADASVLAALDDETIVLTDDVNLYSQALFQGREAINFNHLRQYGLS